MTALLIGRILVGILTVIALYLGIRALIETR